MEAKDLIQEHIDSINKSLVSAYELMDQNNDLINYFDKFSLRHFDDLYKKAIWYREEMKKLGLDNDENDYLIQLAKSVEATKEEEKAFSQYKSLLANTAQKSEELKSLLSCT